MAVEYHWGTGRRKSAVARVRVKKGSGSIVVNNKEYTQYFTRERDRIEVIKPLRIAEKDSEFDVIAKVEGSGITGQAGAVQLGIARALIKAHETLEPVLREHGMLTRDSRMKERKKYGQPGARKRFQYSKR
ncbi:MAG: 30S ribosomal protein S9 [Planctomycetota bacterium]|nr:MAG: 30S ribosomal protein S9 [Planctomycetota bacterium]